MKEDIELLETMRKNCSDVLFYNFGTYLGSSLIKIIMTIIFIFMSENR